MRASTGGALDEGAGAVFASGQVGNYRLCHRPALDGVRGLAVAMVVLSHTCVPLMVGAGTVGVTLFFVLSGFLITRLLLEEGRRTGTVDLAAFFVRRVRRLLPALLLFLGLVSVAFAGQGLERAEAVSALTYTADLTHLTGVRPRFLAHTWSLSLEEQFYLVWPFLLVPLFRTRRRWLMIVIMLGTLAVVVNRSWWAYHGDMPHAFFAPDTRADALLVGCLVALTIDRLGKLNLGLLMVPAAAVLLVAFPCDQPQLVALLVPVTFASAVVVAWAATTTSGSWLSARPWRGLGRISYAVYLWHYPIAMVFVFAHLPWWLVTAATVPLTLAIAALSWRCVESPILNRRRPSRDVLVSA